MGDQLKGLMPAICNPPCRRCLDYHPHEFRLVAAEKFLQVIADPDHEEHESTLEWTGGHLRLDHFTEGAPGYPSSRRVASCCASNREMSDACLRRR